MVRELKYKDPIEMLTCDLCIFGGPAARDFNIEDIKAGKRLIIDTCERLQRNPEQPAHPLAALRVATGKAS